MIQNNGEGSCKICLRLRTDLAKSQEEVEKARLTRIIELQKGVERLSELLWGARCVYCGEIIGNDRKNQSVADDALKNHIKSCPEHPLSKSEARVTELEEALKQVGGASCRLHRCGVIAEQALKGGSCIKSA